MATPVFLKFFIIKTVEKGRRSTLRLGGAIIKLANFFDLNDFLCMNGVDIGATMSPLNFFGKIPSGVCSAERFASLD
jgi:hypothetical protein